MNLYVKTKDNVKLFVEDLKTSGCATGKSLLSLVREQLFDDIKKVNIPILVLHDPIYPVEFATYLNKNILNSSSIYLVESGHAGFFEEKNKVST